MQPLISVRGLHYRFPDGTLALAGVDFDLFPGESVVLLGANGSGKTTFVLHLNGLLRGESEVRVCGIRVEKKTLDEIRRRVGMVFQDADDQVFMPSVLEDVAFGPRNLGLSPAEAAARARAALRQVGVEAFDRPPYHLSAGEKRRVAIAGVLAMQPDVLVLDEPTTFLDPPGRKDLIRTLNALPQAKIIVTHDAGFARAAARRAVFFEKGRIAAEGPVDEILLRFDWET